MPRVNARPSAHSRLYTCTECNHFTYMQSAYIKVQEALLSVSYDLGSVQLPKALEDVFVSFGYSRFSVCLH